MRESGIADEMIIGPEFEFHVFDNVQFETRPECVRCEIDTEEADWNTGSSEDGFQVPTRAATHRCSAGQVLQSPQRNVHAYGRLGR